MKKSSIIRSLSAALLAAALFVPAAEGAEKVSEVKVPSASMSKTVPAFVVLPDSYETSPARFPVLYLLHGQGEQYRAWLLIRPDLQKLASLFNMIVVCPDALNSWYLDSPVNPKSRYETFIVKELVPYIDANYKTIPNRKGRAISGLSMGGHGGLWLGFRHQDVFGACGSTSGALDISVLSGNGVMKDVVGDFAKNPENWGKYTVISQLHLLKPHSIRIIFDCGTSDVLHPSNKKLHEELLYRQIPHDYIERPGAHTSAYWANALPYQMWFFKTGFDAAGK